MYSEHWGAFSLALFTRHIWIYIIFYLVSLHHKGHEFSNNVENLILHEKSLYIFNGKKQKKKKRNEKIKGYSSRRTHKHLNSNDGFFPWTLNITVSIYIYSPLLVLLLNLYVNFHEGLLGSSTLNNVMFIQRRYSREEGRHAPV